MAIIEQSKEIAEMRVKALLQTDQSQQMTYLGLFDTEYNEMKRKRLSFDYLLLDAALQSSNSKQPINKNSKTTNPCQSRSAGSRNLITSQAPQQQSLPPNRRQPLGSASKPTQPSELDKARYMIRDFLLWRQLLLNIRNEKDKELSLTNTSWLSYAKLLQWLE